MAGILTIIKKEFTDHVSDHTFLLVFGVLLIVMVAGSFVFILNVQDWAYQEILNRDLEEASLAWKIIGPEITNFVSEPFSFFGMLVTIVLSFNSLNKERSEGSLKVLLSYPIGKSKIVFGKLIGGLLVVIVVTVVSMTISFSLIMYVIAIPLTLDYLYRILSVTLLGIILLFFYLCVGTAVSIMIKDTSAALMGILLIIIALRPDFIVMMVTIILGASSLFGVVLKLPSNLGYYPGMRFYYSTEYRNFQMFSPSESFLGFSNNIFRFVNPSGSPTVYIPLEFEWLLPKSIDLAQSMIVLTAISLVICCILFLKKEVA